MTDADLARGAIDNAAEPTTGRRRFKIEGLDCQNEVRRLKAAVGPIAGGDEMLAFDTKAGLMEVTLTQTGPTDEAIIAAVARTGMRVVSHIGPQTKLLFEIDGMDCQNEVRQLKAAVGPLVGGDDKLGLDTKQGTMQVSPQDLATIDEIEKAVSATGMRARLRRGASTSGAAKEAPLAFRVRGLDCQNEVRQLKAVVGPLVGGDDKLTFDTKTGTMWVASQSQSTTLAIQNAVATTGMSAEVVAELGAENEQATRPFPAEAVCTTCSGDPIGDQDLIATVPILPGQVVFKVHGMDCGDEVAALKREVGPVVGGEDKLAFDLVNGRMSVLGRADALPIELIEKAVLRTGMTAELWQEGVTSDATMAEERRRRTQTILTSASGLLVAAGLALHAVLGGGLAAAVGAVETTGGTPLPAIAAYVLSIVFAVRYVAPKALLSARRLRPDMNLLMVVAVAGAIGIGEWFEAATVSFFFALALALEAWSLGRARRAVAALMELAPTVARVRHPDGNEAEVPAGQVAVGAHIVVRPGDKIPLDGRVVAGESEVNQAPITGESVPVPVEPGKEVFAGTINGEGALEVQTSKAAQDTTLARIIRMVGSAQSRRAPTEQWVEQFARVYTPAVMVLALVVFLVPPLAFGGSWEPWFYRALVLLVIACPCALVISTPVTIVAALAGAAKQGVLVKGGVHLETPAKLKAIAMDKTGTLTVGRPRVVELVPLGVRTEAELLEFAAALEARSEHPLARAILEKAQERGITVAPAATVQAVRGKGVTGRIGAREAWLGSRKYLEERATTGATPEVLRSADRIAGAGRTVVAVGDEESVWGLIAVSDAIRPEAKRIVAELHAAGIERVVMLTGDNRATAEVIARETGVDEVQAELLPEDKVAAIERLVGRFHKSGSAVAMIGDGVNDAPAMARADLGIAMGAIGSDAAIETADVALMSDDLSKLPWLIRHSKATLAIIRQNIGFSLAVKLLFTGLTIAGFASLWGAIAADVGASLLVVLNGLRLLTRDQP
jgi:Cd2+/Zn2+-exporting ATPase